MTRTSQDSILEQPLLFVLHACVRVASSTQSVFFLQIVVEFLFSLRVYWVFTRNDRPLAYLREDLDSLRVDSLRECMLQLKRHTLTFLCYFILG